MYRYSNGQISLSDFQQPMGVNVNEKVSHALMKF